MHEMNPVKKLERVKVHRKNVKISGFSKLSHYLPPLILMALIFVMSSIPMDGKSERLKFMTDLAPTVQNILHIPVFDLLAYLWLRSLAKHGFSRIQKLISTMIITVGYGILDEVHQLFVPGRYASLSDVVMNILGITIGIIIFLQLERRLKLRR